MTNFAGVEMTFYGLAYAQPQSSDVVPLPSSPPDFAPVLVDLDPIIVTQTQHVTSPKTRVNAYAAAVMPNFADDLFNHILIVPGRLDLGNILANQTRTLEIANLFFEPVSWTALVNTVDGGITFPNAPTFPRTISSLGNFILQVGVAAEGAPSIAGNLELDFDVQDIFLAVTGQRIVMCQFPPQGGIIETLEWLTDIQESYDGTEQRAGVRKVPRQRMSMSLLTSQQHDMNVRALMFGWLPNVFGVPVWFEQSPLTKAIAVLDNVVHCDTTAYDFRVGGLIMVYTDVDTFDVVTIQSMDSASITLTSNLTHAYALTAAVVMPVRTALAVTTPAHHRAQSNNEQTDIEFVVLDNADLADVTGAHTYDSKILLDDPNFLPGDTMDEGWDRPVVIIDQGQHNPVQTTRTDRSRPHLYKGWNLESAADVWRIRRLLHALHGSRTSFFLPSFRADLQLTETVAGGATALRVVRSGYVEFMQGLRPFGDVRIVLNSGTVVLRRVTGVSLDLTNNEGVISLNGNVATTDTLITDVKRIELISMVRIADDKATFTHLFAGCADVTINLLGVKA